MVVPEKIEGLALGPQLADGTFSLILVTDNDFSVTQLEDADVQVRRLSLLLSLRVSYPDQGTAAVGSRYPGPVLFPTLRYDWSWLDQSIVMLCCLQSDVYYSANGTFEIVDLGAKPKNGNLTLIPSFVLNFKTKPGVLDVSGRLCWGLLQAAVPGRRLL